MGVTCGPNGRAPRRWGYREASPLPPELTPYTEASAAVSWDPGGDYGRAAAERRGRKLGPQRVPLCTFRQQEALVQSPNPTPVIGRPASTRDQAWGDTSGLTPRSGRREVSEAGSISDGSSSPLAPPAFPLPCPLAPSPPRPPCSCPLPQGLRPGSEQALRTCSRAQRADSPGPCAASAEGTREVCAATAPHSCLAPRVSQAGLSLQPGEKRFQRAGSPRLDGETGAGSGLSHLHARGTRSHRPPAFKPAASQRLRLPEQDRLPPRTW